MDSTHFEAPTVVTAKAMATTTTLTTTAAAVAANNVRKTYVLLFLFSFCVFPL